MASGPTRRRVIRNGAMAAAQVVVLGLSLFVLYRVILETIGIERLGVWSLVLATTSVGRMAQLGIGHGVVRFVSRELARGDREAVAEVIDTAALATAALAAAGVLALYPLARWYVAFTVPAPLLGEALPLVPWALGSLALALLTGVWEAGLDGHHRLDLRTVPAMATTVVYVGVAIALAPAHGLLGLAIAQLVQAALSLVTTRALLHAVAPGLPLLPARWSRARLRELLAFGTAVQAMNVGVLVLDPLAKALIARAGVVGAVGWFEMANRMVTQLRALAAAAAEALVPAISHLGAREDRGAMKAAYVDAARAMVFLVPVATAATAIAIPVISELWIGRFQPEFVAFAWTLTASLLPSLVAVPAFYSNLALGHLRPNAVGIATILAATLLVGGPLAATIGPLGAALGLSAGFALGHAIILVAFHRREAVPLRAVLPRGTAPVSLASALAAASGLALYFRLAGATGAAERAVAVLAVSAAVLGPAVWLHPFRRELQACVLPRGQR